MAMEGPEKREELEKNYITTDRNGEEITNKIKHQGDETPMNTRTSSHYEKDQKAQKGGETWERGVFKSTMIKRKIRSFQRKTTKMEIRIGLVVP